jgi:anti-sigma factor RsiW
MMCEAWGEELSAWMDGELSPQRAREAAQHVQACDACQRGLRAFRQVDSVMKAEAAPRISARVTAPAMALVRERARTMHGPSVWQSLLDSFWPKFTLTVAGAALAGLLAFVVAPNLFFSGQRQADEQASLSGRPATGELAVANSAAGANDVADLALKLGGSVSSYQTAGSTSTVLVKLPPGQQQQFIDGLSKLGTWTGQTTPASSAAIAVRVIERP